MPSRVTAKNVGDVFLRHTVVASMHYRWIVSVSEWSWTTSFQHLRRPAKKPIAVEAWWRCVQRSTLSVGDGVERQLAPASFKPSSSSAAVHVSQLLDVFGPVSPWCSWAHPHRRVFGRWFEPVSVSWRWDLLESVLLVATEYRQSCQHCRGEWVGCRLGWDASDCSECWFASWKRLQCCT